MSELADAIRVSTYSGDGDFKFQFCLPYDKAIPPPECITYVESSYGPNKFTDNIHFTLKSMDDVEKANEWLLRRASIASESHHLSLISVLIYFGIVETMFWTKGDIETVEEEERYKHLVNLRNRFDIPFHHPIFESMDLLCTNEMELTHVVNVAHLTNQYRKAECDGC